jgi:hypothetical protein
MKMRLTRYGTDTVPKGGGKGALPQGKDEQNLQKESSFHGVKTLLGQEVKHSALHF